MGLDYQLAINIQELLSDLIIAVWIYNADNWLCLYISISCGYNFFNLLRKQ